MEEAVTLMKRMTELGVVRFTFTPHVAYPEMINDRQTVEAVFNILKRHAEKAGITADMEVTGEYRMGEHMLELLKRGEVSASRDGDVLVEHSFYAPSHYTDEILFRLERQGMQPVLAHPERYPFYEDNILRHCQEMKNKGCKLQVNILSLAGFYGRKAEEGARKLYQSGLVDYYASDLHGSTQMNVLEAFIRQETGPQ